MNSMCIVWADTGVRQASIRYIRFNLWDFCHVYGSLVWSAWNSTMPHIAGCLLVTEMWNPFDRQDLIHFVSQCVAVYVSCLSDKLFRFEL